jgi:hypothetical protein
LPLERTAATTKAGALEEGLMRNNHELTVSLGHLTDSEAAAAIRYLDPTPTSEGTSNNADTVLVIVLCIFIFLVAAVPFVSLYLKTS